MQIKQRKKKVNNYDKLIKKIPNAKIKVAF